MPVFSFLRVVNGVLFFFGFFSIGCFLWWAPPLEASPADQIFEHIIVAGNGLEQDAPPSPHCKGVGDISGDGFADIVAASSVRHEELVWYEYPSWSKQVISDSGAWSTDLEIGDVDGDGDNDIIISAELPFERVEWYENPAPLGSPAIDEWDRHTIGEPWMHDIEVGDLERDGDLDVVGRGKQNTDGHLIHVWRRVDGEWAEEAIACPGGEGLKLHDLDRDGDLDIIIAQRWYENDGIAADRRWIEHIYAPEWSHPDNKVEVGDFNDDGHDDIVLSPSESSYKISWFEAPSPAGPFIWVEHPIEESAEFVHSLATADFDVDGRLDIALAEMHQSEDPDEVLVYFNNDNGATWTRTLLSTMGSHNIVAADIGNDGDFDIVGANWDSVAPNGAPIELWRNTLDPVLSLDKWQRHVIDDARPWRAIFITANDLNGDGLKDVVSGGWWYENPGSAGGFWVRHTIGSPLNNFARVFDFDGDGDFDVLGTRGQGSTPSADFVWAENDGSGQFTIRSNIEPGNGDFLQGVTVGRLEPNGPIEVALSWHRADVGIQSLTIPDEPTRVTWRWGVISPNSQDEDLKSGDVDGDGDFDLLLGTVLLRNNLNSWAVELLSPIAEPPDRNAFVDVNGDGYLDAVVGFEAISVPGRLAWYEQPLLSDFGVFWTEHVISDDVVGPMSLDVADMDNDRDIDIVVGEHNLADPQSARLLIFENSDQSGTEWREHLVSVGDEHHDGAQVVDIDGDGDLDIISIGWSHAKVVLYENLSALEEVPEVAIDTLISPQSGVFREPVLVTIRSRAPGVPIFYTLDGSSPTEGSAPYEGPFLVTESSVVKARAFLDGHPPSDVATSDYIIFESSGARTSDGLRALYYFDDGLGEVVHDDSGVGEPLDLIIENPPATNWIEGGLEVHSRTLISSFGAAGKLVDALVLSNEMTAEAWIRPASADLEGPARILTLSPDSHSRDFTLGQTVSDGSAVFDVRLRTTDTDDNGLPEVLTPALEAPTELNHVVYTRNAAGTARIYVNGAEVVSSEVAGEMTNWDTSFSLSIADEFTADRPWFGEFYLAAFYDRALQPEEVAANFLFGPYREVSGLPFRRGDVNDDGAVGLSDPVALLFFLFLGNESVGCEDAADSNDNGVLELGDVLVLLDYVFIGETLFLATPGAVNCDHDRTRDQLTCERALVCTPPVGE